MTPQQLLEQCGFELAIGPLTRMFEAEQIDDPALQYRITLDVIERTIHSLALMTQPRTIH